MYSLYVYQLVAVWTEPMENPFSFSNYVTGEAFCNREKEQKDLIYYAQNSQNVLLYSHRRMGKTSLIQQVIARLKRSKPKVGCVYIDLFGTLDENEFIDAVLSGIAQIENRVGAHRDLKSRQLFQDALEPVTGLPSLSASITPVERPEYLEKVLSILESYSEKQKLLVVFDEFQEIAKYSEKGFEKRLRKVIQLHKKIAYIFSGSQKHLLIEMFDSTKRAFYKMARGYPLEDISLEAYIMWAKRLFKKKNVFIEDDIIAEVVRRCEYQPMYIQQFLFDLWRQSTVSLDVLDEIQWQVMASHRNQFMMMWDLLTQNQKKVLKLIAETGGQGIYRAEQLQRVGFNSGSVLQRALKSLVEKGILHRNSTYEFQDAVLKMWVKSHS